MFFGDGIENIADDDMGRHEDILVHDNHSIVIHSHSSSNAAAHGRDPNDDGGRTADVSCVNERSQHCLSSGACLGICCGTASATVNILKVGILAVGIGHVRNHFKPIGSHINNYGVLLPWRSMRPIRIYTVWVF